MQTFQSRYGCIHEISVSKMPILDMVEEHRRVKCAVIFTTNGRVNLYPFLVPVKAVADKGVPLIGFFPVNFTAILF